MFVYVLLLTAATPVRPVYAEPYETPVVAKGCTKFDCSFDDAEPSNAEPKKAVPEYRCIDGSRAPRKSLCGPVAVPEEKQYDPRPPIPTKATRPIPRNNPGSWVTTYDYPTYSLAYDEEGTTGFRLTVAVDGKVSDCAVTSSSRFALLDAATCKHITRRARFTPALDNDGNPIEGSYSNRVTWRIPAMPSFAQQIDLLPSGPQATFGVRIEIDELDYPLEALEKGVRGHANVLLLISEMGSVKSCSIKASTGSPLLDKRSCELASEWTFLPARDSSGKAIAGDTSHDFVWILPDAWKSYQKTGLYPAKPAN